MKNRVTCSQCGGPLDRRGHCPQCRVAAPSKTVMMRSPAGQAVGLASPEPAADQLASIPLPDGWEIVLDIVGGPQAGDSFELRHSRSLIGRGQVDVTLADPQISRTHASIEVYGGQCVLIKDLDSMNGTFVNGQRVNAVEVEDGDEIRIGENVLAISIATPVR